MYGYYSRITSAARSSAYVFGVSLFLICSTASVVAQDEKNAASLDMKSQRDRGREMLDEIRKDVKQHYFDAGFHGLDLEAKFHEAETAIEDAVSGDQIYGIIAHMLLAFNDSHTYFIPPLWSMQVDYGWEMQMFGDACYVTSVELGSDADLKGLRPGDRILAVFDIPVMRDNLWQIKYLFKNLRPLKSLTVTLQVPGGKPQRAELLAKVVNTTWRSVMDMENRQKYSPQFYHEVNSDLFLWTMPQFNLADKSLDAMMEKVRKHKALVLDLRGNGGGYEVVLQRLLGYFFDHDVKIGERRGRKDPKALNAKTRGNKAFSGQLVVLVDSLSASAAEIFARVIQLEKRGTVIGDRTAGAVTEAEHFYHDYAQTRKGRRLSFPITYGVSLTVNNLIMADGKSLEHVGVTPDEIVLPAPADFESGKDAPLQRAAELLGVKLDLTRSPAQPVPN